MAVCPVTASEQTEIDAAIAQIAEAQSGLAKPTQVRPGENDTSGLTRLGLSSSLFSGLEAAGFICQVDEYHGARGCGWRFVAKLSRNGEAWSMVHDCGTEPEMAHDWQLVPGGPAWL